MSTLYDRRLLVLLLKNYSHGRRAFTEGCRISKMLLTNRGKCYEESTYTKKYNIQTQTNIQEKQLINTKTTPPYECV